MRYVILRDDDTCALTPPECLDLLYRPLLDRGLPVHLSVIPDVRTDALRGDGRRERFLQFSHETHPPFLALATNRALIDYLRAEPLLRFVHHGYDHTLNEFDCGAREAARRLEMGTRRLAATGLAAPAAFVAPQDRFSGEAIREVARRYNVISSGWYELSRLPRAWWPAYLLKRWRRQSHWRVGRTLLLTHPGCILSGDKSCDRMEERVRRAVGSQPLTILVTHWAEYFRDRRPDEEFIRVLHRVGDFLAGSDDIRVTTFADLASGWIPIPGLTAAVRPRPADLPRPRVSPARILSSFS